MKYYSTRDKNVSLSAAEAVKMGLSRDGGLLTPEEIPQIDRRFLESLGFVAGSTVSIVSENGGNFIVNVKGSRIALSKALACKIFVA